MLQHEVYVALGSNLEDPVRKIEEALQLLQGSVSDLRASSFYRTSPMYIVAQPDFVNAVCTFKTALTPEGLLGVLQDIESKLGKVARPKNAPRVIDLDILFYGEREVQMEHLQIPHPKWRERLFVIRPLADLTSWIMVKGERIDIQALLQGVYPGQEIALLEEAVR